MRRTLWIVFVLLLASIPALAQQTGSLSGQVTLATGEALPGVVVEVTSDVLPRPRATASGASGDYRLPLLPPGSYQLTFTMEGMDAVTRTADVFLQTNTAVDVAMGAETIEEAILVVGAAPVIDVSSAEIKSSIGETAINSLPVGQEYRDIVKLIPGVQYSEDSVRGPSAGGSGQDNVYQFDGVNVGLPMFGVLSAEPSSHDIAQVTVVKGGAKAVDFNRAGGFTINSLSKTGTNQFRGEVGYQLQTDSMTGDRDTVSDAEFEQDRDWATMNIGGPIVQDLLNFYVSYYRPTVQRDNRSNLYGDVPDFESTRDEFFGKLSLSPTDSVLLHGSYRTSDREGEGVSVGGESSAGSTSEGNEATLDIAIAEGTWVINDNSYASFRYTDFANETLGGPDTLFSFPIRTDGSVGLDIGNLDQQGHFFVPQPIAGQDAYNEFIVPYVERYGYSEGGVQVGGGDVGGGTTINEQDFFRESIEVSYDYLLDTEVSHEFHFGYQKSSEEEDLSRLSNGWGSITVPGGRTTTSDGTPIFFEARFEQMSITDGSGAVIPPIHSEFESQSIEFNDTIRWDNWTFNIGFLLSNDELYGQGLAPNSSNTSGFELSPGSKYKMYELDFGDMVQPRLGATWAYNGRDTAYLSFAQYMPAASSLPRAASWARNLRRSIRAFFDAGGNLISTEAVRSSSGKFFQEDLDPRTIDEYIIGTSRQLTSNWTGKAHFRYRKGHNFWEDTNNNARSRFDAPAGFPQEDYIPNLSEVRGEIGGSSYVIAELDNAFTKYYEASLEGEWRGNNAYFRGSYVWSHYYGTFDQDNTTTSNDQAIFIGSSNLADGAGRQIWNFKYGNLKGDRRHQLKLYGFYNLSWNASVGAYAIYQSGQPWEAWDSEVYRAFTSSTSDTNRYAEPAGSRTTSAHHQIDLNYTHNFPIGDRFTVRAQADVFNVYDNQTGYNVQNKVNSSGFGDPKSFYDPRRFQVAIKLLF